MRPGGETLPQDLQRPIGTAVDDEHDFEIVRELRGKRVELGKQPRQVLLVLVDGDHEREHGGEESTRNWTTPVDLRHDAQSVSRRVSRAR